MKRISIERAVNCFILASYLGLVSIVYGNNIAKEWDKTLGGSGSDYAYSVIQTSDGGYLVVGYSLSSQSGDKTEDSRGDADYWVVKISTNGVKEWDKTFGGSSYDNAFSVIETSDGGYLVAGKSESPNSGDKTDDSRGGADYWLSLIHI